MTRRGETTGGEESENNVQSRRQGKIKYEVITGEAFHGVQYPLGALVYHKCKAEGIAEPTTKPGLFAGWKLESGSKCKEIVHTLDYDSLRMRNHKRGEPKSIHQREVYFPSPEHFEFPFQNAARKPIADASDPKSFSIRLHDAGAGQITYTSN